MNMFTKTAALAVLLSNDFWYMHIYAKDEDFDKSHALTFKYYSTLYEDADELMELALQENYDIINPNNVSSIFPEYNLESDKFYSYSTIIQKSREKISIYVDSLKQLRNFTDKTDIQSKIDSWLEFWNKELNYKLARRSNTPTSLNGFINTGFDDALAYIMSGGKI